MQAQLVKGLLTSRQSGEKFPWVSQEEPGFPKEAAGAAPTNLVTPDLDLNSLPGLDNSVPSLIPQLESLACHFPQICHILYPHPPVPFLYSIFFFNMRKKR